LSRAEPLPNTGFPPGLGGARGSLRKSVVIYIG